MGSRLTFYENFVNESTEFSESHLGKTPINILSTLNMGNSLLINVNRSLIEN